MRYEKVNIQVLENENDLDISNMADINGIGVAEAYSPERVVAEAARQGLEVGPRLWMDLTTGWDFSLHSHREKAVREIKENEPLVLIRSVMCTNWSSSMNGNWGKIEPAEVQRRMVEALLHFEFVCRLARLQHQSGRYYVPEHLESAQSLREPRLIRLPHDTMAKKLIIDQCMFGHKQIDTDGSVKAVKKAATFLKNSPATAVQLNKR